MENPGGDWCDREGVLQGSIPYARGKYENTGFFIKTRIENNNYSFLQH